MTIRLPLDAPAGNPRPRGQSDSQHAALQLDGVSVIVVDDERDSRDLLVSVLERCGASVLPCASASAAVQAVACGPVDLLVADIAMPEVDGYQLMARVREQRPRLPAIAVSAYARPEDRARALAEGYAAYCVKPLDAALFLDMVRHTLGPAAQ